MLKKTLESISFEYRRADNSGTQDIIEMLVETKEGGTEAPEVNAKVETDTAK